MYAILTQAQKVQHSGETEEFYVQLANEAYEDEHDGKEFQYWDALHYLKKLFTVEDSATSASKRKSADPTMIESSEGSGNLLSQKKAKLTTQVKTLKAEVAAAMGPVRLLNSVQTNR